MDFDWDNISIGEPELNTSGSFFFRGVKMEKAEDHPEFDCGVTSSDDDVPDEESQQQHSNDRYKQQQHAKVRQEENGDRAYRYAKVYEQKRKVLRDKEEKQLQDMKKFHARPAPSFKAPAGGASKKENAEPKFTIPLTPKQMKPERLKKATEQAKKMHERTKEPEAAKFRAHDAKVLREEPFKPALAKTVVKAEPFNLRMSARLQERKQFDEQLHRAKEEKARRDAEERRAAEERELKQIRKQKEFKANPNPFK